MKLLPRLLSPLISIAIPFFLLMLAIRLVMTPLFLQVEYRSPGFPEDTYGFTLEDRLYWSRFAVDYLNNNDGIEYLGDLQFADGSPLYNERELSHMVDVKIVYQGMLRALLIVSAALAALGIWAWRGRWLRQYGRGLAGGGWLTLGLIGIILVAVATNFLALFAQFHALFFASGTWTFEYSDTLIRLLPLRLWRDGFIVVGAVTISGALLSVLGGNALARRE